MVRNIHFIPDKMSIYTKDFFAIYLALVELGHIFWGATKHVITMTDRKSVTRFFQTKMIPPPLWNACDFVLQFNFSVTPIPENLNTAEDSLSRLEVNSIEEINQKNREDIPTKPIEVNFEPTGIEPEEAVFFDTIDQHETREKEIWKRKEETRNASVIIVSRHYANELHKDTTIVNIAQSTKASQVFIEQDSYPT